MLETRTCSPNLVAAIEGHDLMPAQVMNPRLVGCWGLRAMASLAVVFFGVWMAQWMDYGTGLAK